MDSATPYHRCASVVVHVWISQSTCLDLSPVRDSFARDHHALLSGRSRPARRIRGRDCGSVSDYFRHARWFFGSLVTVLLVSLLKTAPIDGSLPRPFDLGFHLFWIAGASVAAATHSDL